MTACVQNDFPVPPAPLRMHMLYLQYFLQSLIVHLTIHNHLQYDILHNQSPIDDVD